MTAWRENLILLTLWGMNLSWLYGWAAVLMLAGFGRLFPQSDAIMLSGLAVLLTLFTRRRGWRNVYIVGLHLVVLILACGAVLYHFAQTGMPFYRVVWLVELFSRTKSPGQWLLLGVALGWGLAFWAAGTRLAARPRNHITISNYFDAGIIAFVLLHLLEAILKTEGGIVLTELSLPRIFLAFFLFGVVAFCLARCQGQGRSDFLVGFRGIGVVLGFASLMLALGGGLIALFLPVLTAAAKTGVAVLQTVSAPAGALLVKILTFFFGHARMKQDQAGTQSGQDALLQTITGWQLEGWLVLLQEALLVLTIGVIFLLALALTVLVGWQLVWWLAQKTGKASPGPSPWRMVWAMIVKIAAAFAGKLRRLRRPSSRAADPVQLYRTLTIWGERSGLALLPSETPSQYGSRLIRRFPAVQDEIRTIIRIHDEAVYGQRRNLSCQMEKARLSNRRLHAPRVWPVRLKSLLFR